MWTEVRTSVVANIGFLFFGISLAWSSVAGPQIVQNESYRFWISNNEFGFVVGSMSLGAMCSCILSGVVRHKIGTRQTIFWFSLFAVIGSILLTVPWSLYSLILGRFLIGISIGCYSFLVPVYVGEISSNKNRGLMLGFLNILLNFGIFFIYILGYFTSLKTVNIICGSIPLFYSVAFYAIPESPIHLLGQGEYDKSVRTLVHLRGNCYDSKEILSMRQGLRQAEEKSFSELIRIKSVRKALIIIMFQFFCFQLSGGNAVVFYSLQIYIDAQVQIEPISAALFNSLLQFVGALVATFYIRKHGRKTMMVTFNALLMLSLVALGFYFLLKENGSPLVENLKWLPLLALCIYLVAFGLGMAPITYIWLGEMFTLEAKKTIAPLGQVVNHSFTFLVGLSFPYLTTTIGSGLLFLTFALVTFMDILFVIFYVPETIGRSVDEIQDSLSK